MIPYRLQHAATQVCRHAVVLRGMCHLDTKNLDGTVLLAGSGRSGTTWLGQIINHGNPYRDVFEPLHPGRVKQVSGWPVLRYLSPSDGRAVQGETIQRLLSGRVRSRWTDAYNRRTFARQRLIKAIRANLLLGWVHEHCPQVKILFATRHPCAVSYSRLKLGWDTHLDELLAQPELMHDHLEPFRETIERAEFEGDAWQRHLTMWCIENRVPLRQLRPGDAHVMQYERFCETFDDEIGALFHFLGKEKPQGIQNVRRQQSAHYRRDSAILRGGNLVGDWQTRLSAHQVDQALTLLDTFGLSHLYNERAMPCCDSRSAFIQSSPTDRPDSLYRDAA